MKLADIVLVGSLWTYFRTLFDISNFFYYLHHLGMSDILKCIVSIISMY